jgi:hypothetical protein
MCRTQKRGTDVTSSNRNAVDQPPRQSNLIDWRHSICQSELDPIAKLVAFVIACHMDGGGHSWPSRQIIAKEANSHVRTIERAIKRVEDAGLLCVQHSPGRHVNHYYITTSNSGAGAAVEPPLTAALGPPLKPPTAALGTSNSGAGAALNSKEIETAPREAHFHELRGAIIANYSSKGGSLEKEGWRDILAKHVTQLLKAGTDPDLIMTAAGLLAREPDPFPGHLTKLVKQIQTEGMPCKHRGDQRGLTKAQLEECGCPDCLGRIAFAEAKGLDIQYLQPLKAA